MKPVTGLVLLASIILSSCAPSTGDNVQTTEEAAQSAEEIAAITLAATAEIDAKIAQAIRETEAARPTNTSTSGRVGRWTWWTSRYGGTIAGCAT